MNKQYRSYSDHEIANYVLGIDMSEQTNQGIQHNLTNDNAAAARALKWEAYFLSLVDGLKPVQPSDEILKNIQITLDLKLIDKPADEIKNMASDQIDSEIKYEVKEKKPKSKIKIAVSVLVLLILGFITWASLKAPPEPSMTQQTIHLNK